MAAPNGEADVLGENGDVVEEVNLWGEVSFDLGPTLGVWLDRHAPAAAAAIAAGDASGDAACGPPQRAPVRAGPEAAERR